MLHLVSMTRTRVSKTPTTCMCLSISLSCCISTSVILIENIELQSLQAKEKEDKLHDYIKGLSSSDTRPLHIRSSWEEEREKRACQPVIRTENFQNQALCVHV